MRNSLCWPKVQSYFSFARVVKRRSSFPKYIILRMHRCVIASNQNLSSSQHSSCIHSPDILSININYILGTAVASLSVGPQAPSETIHKMPDIKPLETTSKIDHVISYYI